MSNYHSTMSTSHHPRTQNPNALFWSLNPAKDSSPSKPSTTLQCFRTDRKCPCPMRCDEIGKCGGYELSDLTPDQKFGLMFGKGLS